MQVINKKHILLIIVILATFAGLYVYFLSIRQYPSTDDAYVQANVVRMAPRVGGQVATVAVVNNQHVKKAKSYLH